MVVIRIFSFLESHEASGGVPYVLCEEEGCVTTTKYGGVGDCTRNMPIHISKKKRGSQKFRKIWIDNLNEILN